jgi:hypothetical protein
MLHVARLNGSVDVDAVMTTLVKMLDDPEVFGYAEDVLNSIEIYMKTDRRRHMGARAEPDPQRVAP